MSSHTLVFYVNGKKVEDSNVNPDWTLLQYLRNQLRLCGTKLGCGEGGCGACTVMLSRLNRKSGKVAHISVNACLYPVCACHGASVTTVEGIGSVATKLHPVQERIAKSHGSQCGFCTPGIVMSMYTLLRNKALPSMHDMEDAFQGNLCRCTGYRPILEGYKTLTCCGTSGGGGCCGKISNGNGCCMSVDGADVGTKLFESSEFTPYDPSQEPIFPPELMVENCYDRQSLILKGERTTWYRPTSLTELLAIKDKYPSAKMIVGNTEVGVEVKFKHFHYPILIHPIQIPELTVVTPKSDGIIIGASVTLSNMEAALRLQIDSLPEHKTRIYAAIVEMLRWFAGRQIRNAGCVGGNIMTGSPISDLIPIFMAAGCCLTVQSKGNKKREIVMDHTFFTGYRKTVVKPEEVLVSVYIPHTQEDEYFLGYKQARRRDDDIAIVNAGLRVLFNSGTSKIKGLWMAYGGMAPMAVMPCKTMAKAVGKEWNNDLVDIICAGLIEDLPLDPSAPGSMIAFRRSLVLSFYYKFHLSVQQKLHEKIPKLPAVPQESKSAISLFHSKTPKSAQLYQIVPPGQAKDDAVGRILVHKSALKQVTGEAVYMDDIPRRENELYLALVMSQKAHARLVNVDPSAALKLQGVTRFFSAEDLTADQNITGPMAHDDVIFATDTVTCIGQVIGAIVADNQDLAQRAARMVKVDYEELPCIVTIKDAIEQNSFHKGTERCIYKGSLEQGYAEADHELEGEFHMGGQEHFYLETQATLAVPLEHGEIELHSSCQNPTELQILTSHALGIPANHVVIKVKRLGGGFGGKETRFGVVGLPVAIAAHKLGRPVRCMLDRDEDMAISGGRHPFYAKYKVGFTNEGQITAFDVQIYNNAGNTLDLSVPVLERSLFHIDNAYRIPNLRVKGVCCATNLASNTAFRGFGGPQGMMFCEYMMDHVANYLGVDPLNIRAINLYQENDSTHYNQPLTRCTAIRCWEEVITHADYEMRRNAVKKFNSENRWKKRGLAVIPTKFGISFTAFFFNQAGALVLVYRDGSVLVSHGGTEMGQGLHTKMIQVASRALRISSDKIHIMETATDKVPNTSATAASASSDLNGMAVVNACKMIMDRLEPYISADPKGTWEDWVSKAYFDRVSLAASGFYKTPDVGYDWDKNVGTPFNYFSYGAACSEVEIDCLTGDHQVLHTSIVMDVGESLNPAIDIGQVEGAFVQGQGLFTLEQLFYSPSGFLYTKGPGAYKLPGFADIPQEFNVSLLRGAPNPRAVFSSKAVGEPPLFLASSIFYAIKDAVAAARIEQNISGPFQFNSPATSERIRMACVDKFTEKIPIAPEGTYKPWAVIV